MLGSDFRGFADAVTRTYGDDPWFFLRELAQNSRDAGARAIRVAAATTPAGMETLTFEDDGRGMTLAHARRFLFRLYASDKGGDRAAAGCYGIGFWTILRFRPVAIHLQSRHGDASWAMALDADLNARPDACRLTRPGTVVTLTRPAACAADDEFARQVQGGLRTYCRYLRRNDRRGSMLPLWFAGTNLTEPMALPGPLSLSFRSGPVEGAVGLGEKPEVRLFARGLPVWQGTVLGQMSHLQADADVHAEVGEGLAPVFLLNGNHLDVTFSRNLAVENKALDLVRRKAEAALHRLLETALEKTFPRSWQQRCRDRLLAAVLPLRAARGRLLRPGWHWLPLLLLLLVTLEFIFLPQWFPARPGVEAPWFSLRAAPMSYRGAVVAAPAAGALPLFSYSPGDSRWFRLFAADTYDARSGFIRQPTRERLALTPPPPCPPSAVMRMRLRAESREIFLPMAVGQALLPGSLRLDGRPIHETSTSVQGETVAVLPTAGGRVEYGSCPGRQRPELAPAEASRYTALPGGLTLPEDLQTAVHASRTAPVSARVALALVLTRQRLVYDASAWAAERYRRAGHASSWLAMVLEIGRGDCDVLNGLQVLLLRKMGVPARLVIGMIGEDGKARTRLHAWGEYFDRGWEVSDVTALSVPGPGGKDVRRPGPAYAPPTRARPLPLFSPLRYGPVPFFIMLLALGTGALLLLLRRLRRAGTSVFPSGEEMMKPLLQIARQAFLQPALWGTANPLWRHRLLPTVDGAPVSVQQALRLLRRNRLFMTANRNPLALAMAASRITVLDLSQPLYAPWRTLWEGAVDSDRLCRLRPEPPAMGDSLLLASLNAVLAKRRHQAPALLLTPGLSTPELLRVTLPKPLKDAPFFFPRRFIAVAPGGKILSRAAALYRENPPLAVLRFLRRLHETGLLAGVSAPRQLQRAARRLLLSSHD
jgi:hypothetical protein